MHRGMAFGSGCEVSRVAQRGFVTIEGLLDEEIATAIHQETREFPLFSCELAFNLQNWGDSSK